MDLERLQGQLQHSKDSNALHCDGKEGSPSCSSHGSPTAPQALFFAPTVASNVLQWALLGALCTDDTQWNSIHVPGFGLS